MSMEVAVAALTRADGEPNLTSAALIEAGRATPLIVAGSHRVPPVGPQLPPPGQELAGEIPVIAGLGTTYVNEPPVAVSPVSTFVTTIGPVMSAHPVASALPGMTSISVAETLCTKAAQPASETAAGAWKPWP